MTLGRCEKERGARVVWGVRGEGREEGAYNWVLDEIVNALAVAPEPRVWICVRCL